MTRSSSKPNSNTLTRGISAGLLALSFALAATPALADGKHKHGNNGEYWHDNGNHYGHYKKHPPQVVRYYDDGPDVIYVERPVYVRERVYVEPRRVYREPERPQINIVVPLFD